MFAGTGEEGKPAWLVAMVIPETVNLREAFSLVYGTGTGLDSSDSFDGVRYHLPVALSDFLYGSEYEAAAERLTSAEADTESLRVLLCSTLAETLLLVAAVRLRRRLKPGE